MKYLIVIFTSISLSLTAQKSPIKFGDVSTEELKMIRYEKDTSAEALVLADFGESTLVYDDAKGFYLQFERIKRVKIFKKEGYRFANESIQLYRSGANTEKATSIKAVTYNLEGNKIVETKMKGEGVFREKYDNNNDIIKITLPNVKEGSVIEISYQVESEFIFNFQDWEFQSTIPTKWSEYRVHIPEYFTYDQYMQGYIPVTISENSSRLKQVTVKVESRASTVQSFGKTNLEQLEYKEFYSRWASENVPAFRDEPYMNNYRDYLSRINFELSSTQFPNQPVKQYRGTWENLNREFLEGDSFGGLVKGSGFLNKIVEETIAGAIDPKEKVSKIYSFVKSNVEWDGNYRKYCDGNFKDVFDKKKGNSAEVNLLLVSMIQKAGITSDPVIISTRNHGFVREQYPISSQFNYVIASVVLNDKILLLDATDRTLPMGVLPERCLNGQGFVISASRTGWVKLAPNFKSRTTTNIDMVLSPEGELTGKVIISRDGYFAQKMRKTYISKGEESYLNDLSSAHQWELQKSTFENVDRISDPVKESHEVKIAEQTQTGGDVIYMNPLIKDQISENPFKSEKRLFPVDFGSPTEQMFVGKYTLPEGYVVEELPKPRLLALPNNGGKYVYSISQTNNTIQLTSQLIINQPYFSADEYTALREFYNQVVAKQAEQVVIKKK